MFVLLLLLLNTYETAFLPISVLHFCFTVSKLTVFYVDKLALEQTFSVSNGQHQLLYLPTGVQ